MNEKIVIPEKFYIGYQTRREVATKLGFATYYEENAACRKRQQTIDSWSSKNLGKHILDNTPTKGMRISKNVTHGGGWNDTTTWWRIEDPRGFELEISSGNLAKLLGHCNISEGVLSEDCVWGWDKGNGSKVVLLPVNSEIYKAAQASSAVHYAKSLKLADLKLGDYVELKNETKGIFYGKVTYGHFTPKFPNFGKITLDQTYVIYESGANRLYFMKSPEVIKAEDAKKPFTTEEAERFLMNHIKNDKAITAAGTTDKHSCTVFITYDDKKSIRFEEVLEEIKPEVITKRLNTAIKAREKRSYDSNAKVNNWLGQYDNKWSPVIARTKTNAYVVDGIAQRDIELYYNPKWNYTSNGRIEDPKSGSIVDFLNGSNHLRMNGYRLLDGADGLLDGLRVAQNPHYEAKSSGYSYGGRKTTYEIDEQFWLDEVEKFFELKLKFKNWVMDIRSVRSW